MFIYVCIIYFSVDLFIYLHIHLVLIRDSLDFISYFKVPYNCIVIFISLFIYTEKFVN